jgi:hypothetical protein
MSQWFIWDVLAFLLFPILLVMAAGLYVLLNVA